METQKQNYLPALDGVRGLAVLMVMIFHYCQANHFFPDHPVLRVISKLSVFGQTGVDLFFVLSGFLITRILLKAKKKPEPFFKNFYARRILRIFPLYYGCLLLIYFIIPALTSGAAIPFIKQVWFWSYLQNIVYTFPVVPFEGPNHFWSLAVEEQFYLVWPFLVYFLGTGWLVGTVGASILVGLAVRSVFIAHDVSVVFFTLCRLDGLVLGSVLALLEAHQGGLQKYRKPFLRGAFILLGLLAVIWPLTTGKGLDILQVVKPLLMAIFYLFCVGYVASLSDKGRIYQWMTGRSLTQIGVISYGLYVFHPLCFDWVLHSPLNQNGAIALVASFALTFGVAIASFNYYESHFLKLKKYFAT